MKTIGITGGVGAGKSAIIDYIAENYNCRIIKADNLAHELEMPGNICYIQLIELLGEDILANDNTIDKAKMAAKIFADKTLLDKVNGIVHPAVKDYIINAISEERANNKIDYFFLEAALLIEEGYDAILDELWYIRADESIRRQRLKASRGYTDAKIDSILASQKSDDEFISKCKVVIDNSAYLENSYRQIDSYLR